MTQYIKIPALIKVYFFMLIVVGLTTIIISGLFIMLPDNVGGMKLPASLCLVFGTFITFLGIQGAFFFKKKNWIHHVFLLLIIAISTVLIIMIIYSSIADFYSGIADGDLVEFLIVFIPLLLINIFCIAVYKKLRSFNVLLNNNQENNISENYTDEPQSKWILIGLAVYFGAGILFYIFYFNKPLEMENISDEYFITDYSYLDKINKTNSFNELNKFSTQNQYLNSDLGFLENKSKCILYNACDNYINQIKSKNLTDPLPIEKDATGMSENLKNNKAEYDVTPLLQQEAKDMVNVEEINKLNEYFFTEITNNKYYSNMSGNNENVSYSFLINYARLSLLNSLYDIQNGKQSLGIEKLLKNYELGMYFTKGENQSLLGVRVGITVTGITLDAINYMLDNSSLDTETKGLLLKKLTEDIDIDRIYKNAVKVDFHGLNKEFDEFFSLKIPFLFDGSELKKIRANIAKANIERNFDKLGKIEDEINSRVFQQNYFSRKLEGDNVVSLKSSYKILEGLDKKREVIISKLEK